MQGRNYFINRSEFNSEAQSRLLRRKTLRGRKKTAFYAVLDAFLGKKKMKDALSNVLTNV